VWLLRQEFYFLWHTCSSYAVKDNSDWNLKVQPLKYKLQRNSMLFSAVLCLFVFSSSCKMTFKSCCQFQICSKIHQNTPVVTEQVMLNGYSTRDELTALHTCLIQLWHHFYFHLIFNTSFFALSGIQVWKELNTVFLASKLLDRNACVHLQSK